MGRVVRYHWNADKIVLLFFFYLLEMAVRQSLEGCKKCSALGYLLDFPYLDPEGKEIQIWMRKRK